jgi:glycine oxidase
VNVIVVGGGVIGCATACELARAGCTVILLERGRVGGEASGAAAGILSPLGSSSASLYARVALESWRLYPRVVEDLRKTTGLDIEYATRGTLYPLFTAEDVRRAETRAVQPFADELGVEVLDGNEARRREPSLGREVRGALLVQGDAWVNSERLVRAYGLAATSAGVDLRTGCEVSRVIVEAGRARGVVAGGERLEADLVLLAAGAWTEALGRTCGLRIPVEPRRGQMVALAHIPPVLTHCVHVDDVYLVPRVSGELLLGATVERAGFDRAVTAGGIAGLLRAAIALVPDLARLPVSRTWCGFRPASPDSLPILGPWPDTAGLFVATAHHRNGILLAPVTARLLTEWIIEGRPSMPVKEFLPDRFTTPRGP